MFVVVSSPISTQNLISKREFKYVFVWKLTVYKRIRKDGEERAAVYSQKPITFIFQDPASYANTRRYIIQFRAIVLILGWGSLGNELHPAMITTTPLPIALQIFLDFRAEVHSSMDK